MMNIKKYLFLSLGFIFLFSCHASKHSRSTERISDVFLVQGEKTIKVKSNDVLTIDKAPFALQFYGDRYSSTNPNPIQIAAFLDASVFDKIKVGIPKTDIPNYGPATGIASRELGYVALYFVGGHHYLFYENEQHRRLKLIDEKLGKLQLQFNVGAFFIDGNYYEVDDAMVSSIYLTILIDRNTDGIIDEGELTKMRLFLE